MKKEAASVHVTEECVTEAKSLGCALDKSGNICGKEAAALTHRHNAEVGGKSCEVIVGDLGLCRGDAREDRRLAYVGEADKTDLRKHLELEKNLALLALRTALCKSRDLSCRSGKVSVAPAAASALAEHVFLGVCHIEDYLTGINVADESSLGYGDDNVGAGLAVLLATHTVCAVLGHEFSLVSEGEKGVRALVNAEDYIAAATAVAAVGTARGDVFFSMEGNGTVTAVACLNINFYIVDKHFSFSLIERG